MTEPRDGRGGPATRRHTAQVPGQRTAGTDGRRPPAGRAASRDRDSRAPDATARTAGSRGRGGPRSRRRARTAGRGRRVLKIAAICLSALIVVTAGVGWWFYDHLNGNINSVALDGRGGSETADEFGRTPINILVMGSDGRTSAADCELGGGCSKTGIQKGSNADVEMVVHIAADRSNATIMSIPRDTMTDIPACTDKETGRSTPGYYGQINSALQYGPACQVATVHQLTGIPIDHFIKLDFSGVVQMSDAVGGVSVCVSDDVYDTYSHLKLSKGEHTLKGEAALQFVRSRHGFGDGSDLGRTVSQHIFLSAVMRKFKSAGTLTDPSKVYALADAATKALTVDEGLGSVKKLVSLAAQVNKVPTRRMTFTTMQTTPDPNNKERVVVGPGAKELFATIAHDQSLTTGSGKKSAAASATATPTATVPPSQIAVTVQNGTGVTGRAATVANALTRQGFASGGATGNAPSPASSTTLTYGPGQKAEAQTVAEALGLPSSHLQQGSTAGLVLVIGSDWTDGTSYPDDGGQDDGTAPAPADTEAAVADAHAQTADQDKTCAEVSTYKTVSLNGVAMTPSQAYAAARDVPDSDE
ncbi:LCP family protein [Streptomyces thermoviolaceus]|uniref:LCP family protein n=1 Tax=Streptomyces thermoviolaceus TaxID=1952 RepID=UPI00167A0B36|nr:LCP family protein [Streptomyces thermoviolaceus]GGV70646.1 transcriptional regulator [Streptomyces thermoviolaceus subsp. apingens]GHA86828.1 transcriptional regulator [Streptomyces thermoviolaceus subsp. thermoviolaceus]